jgi:pimeloyl-ACP methyl ester carboxylesterase
VRDSGTWQESLHPCGVAGFLFLEPQKQGRGGMLDDATIKKYYSEVSKEELKRFRDFLETHALTRIEWRGENVPYFCGGTGDRTLLTFSGIHSGPEAFYESILAYEDRYRIVVADVSKFRSLDEFNEAVDRILDREGAGRIAVMGHSFSGFFAQAYFRRNLDRIDAMILTNSMAPNAEKSKPLALLLCRWAPFFIMRAIILRNLNRRAETELEIPPDVKEKVRFKAALMRQIMESRLTKKSLVLTVRMLFEFHEKDEYREGDFKDWPGKVLLITSEDDPYYKDVKIFTRFLPNPQVHSLPKGWKHLAPLVHQSEFHGVIKKFLEGL